MFDFTGLNPMPDGVQGTGGVGLDEIWSMTAVLNEPSQAVMRRLGLTEVARFDQPKIPAGHPLQPYVTYHRPRPQAS